MAVVDPAQRIVVDGVDFASVVHFPRILRSVTSAIRPPRLAVALLMVVLFVAAGRTWDALTEARGNPAGPRAGAPSAEDEPAAPLGAL